jgi:hypothetical protein
MPLRRKKHHKVKCPDGSPRFVPYDFDDAFPLELREADRRTRVRIEVMDQVSAELEQSHAERIREGLFRISSTNDTMMMKLRALYSVYTNDPCGQSGYYAAEISKLVDDHRRSSDLLMHLDTLLNMARLGSKPNLEIVGQILKVITELPGFVSNEATSAIAASRENAKVWMQGTKPNALNEERQNR